MSARDVAVAWLRTQLGAPVLMGYRGDRRFDRTLRVLVPHNLGFNVWDCSGSKAGMILAAGGPDMRGTHNAQMFHDQERELGPTEQPLPGDGVYYGSSKLDVFHVAHYLEGGHIISADGATWGTTDLEVAKRRGCQVREHDRVLYRGDAKYVVVRRNVFLDRIDGVEH